MNEIQQVNNLGAIVAVLVSIIGAVVTVYVARVNSRVKAVHNEVRTNHGKRAGDYLEQVGELRDFLDSFPEELRRASVERQAVRATLIDHTQQDAANFAQLREQLAHLDGKIEGRLG